MILHTAILALVYCVRMFGIFIIYPVFAVMKDAYGTNQNELWIGMILGGYGITQALLQIPFGRLSDRLGRKNMLLFALGLFAAGSAFAAMSEHLLGVLLGRLLQGCGAVAAIIQALVGDLIPERHRAMSMAVIGMSIGLSFMLAMLLAPWLSAALGIQGLFTVSFVAAIVAMVLVACAMPEPHRRADAQTRALPLKHWLTQPRLLYNDTAIGITHFSVTALFLLVPVMLEQRFEIETHAHWKTYLAVLLGSVPGTVLLLWVERRVQNGIGLKIALALIGLSPLLLITLNPALALVALGLYFVGFNTLEALLPTRTIRGVPAHERGSVMGLFSCSQFMGMFIGGLIGGLTLSVGGPQALIALLVLLPWTFVLAGRWVLQHRAVQ